VIEAPLEPDAALLLCTDGLTDMVPSAFIERTVLQHAGDPEQVVDALVAAANGCGGKDNITVVYAEAPDFARAVAQARPGARREPDGSPPGTADAAQSGRGPDTLPNAGGTRPQGNPVSRALRALVRSRTLWFAAGALAGVVGALLLAWRADTADTAAPPRTLVVDAAGPEGYTRIGDAIAAARPGDTVRVEPGVYAEHVVVRDGVDLSARLPGTVTIRRAPGPESDAIGITAAGYVNTRIDGLRIESTSDAPLDVGIRVLGQDVAVGSVELSGPMRTAVDVAPGGALAMDGSLIEVRGAAITAGAGAHIAATRTVFLRPAAGGAKATPQTPVVLTGTADAALTRNFFVGFGADIVKGVSAARAKEIAGANIILAAAAGPAR
jgi:hypothetical protein